MTSVIILPHAVRNRDQRVQIILGEARGGGPPPPPSGLDVWIFYADKIIGALSDLSIAPGLLTYWQNHFEPPNAVPIFGQHLAPASGMNLVIAGADGASGGGPFYAWFGLSTDNAFTWTASNDGSPNPNVFVEADRAAPNIVFASNGYGVLPSGDLIQWYSTDAGLTWTKVTLIVGGASSRSWMGAAMGGAFCYFVFEANPITAVVYVYKMLSDGTFVSNSFATSGTSDLPLNNGQQNDGAIDPTNNDLAYFIGGSALQNLYSLNWGISGFTSQSLPCLPGDAAVAVMVTVLGTVLVFVDAAQSYIMRSTDHGATWDIRSVSAVAPGFLDFGETAVTEAGGVVGVSSGVLIVPLGVNSPFDARFLYSINDGHDWLLSAAIGYPGNTVISCKARS